MKNFCEMCYTVNHIVMAGTFVSILQDVNHVQESYPSIAGLNLRKS